LISSSSMHSYFSLGFLSYCIPHHRLLHSFPTRRSSDLTARIPSAPPLLDASPLPVVVAAAAAGADAAGRPGASRGVAVLRPGQRSEEHTSELQSRENLVCRLLLEKKKRNKQTNMHRTYS